MTVILNSPLAADQKLRQSLILHLRSTVFRLRHGQQRNNELLQYIKTEYNSVYTASWIISMLFEKYFDLQITDDELGYIVLLIQSALERRTQEYNAVILADFARSFAELVSQRIMRYIPEIRQIDILSRYETDNPHYRDADLIITRSSCADPREVVV
ncbi:PRD domain-containing protein, partial [Faecalibaculum rodentium]